MRIIEPLGGGKTPHFSAGMDHISGESDLFIVDFNN